MARQFNAQYQQFKTALQRKFNERYKTDASIQYTEQDLTHAAMIPQPAVPQPYVPGQPVKRNKCVNKTTNKSNPSIDTFEQEYQEFIKKLKAEKAAKKSITPDITESNDNINEINTEVQTNDIIEK